MEHLRKKSTLKIFEQMWRSSEQECQRLEARVEQLATLLRSALYHVRSEGDDTLEELIKLALNEE